MCNICNQTVCCCNEKRISVTGKTGPVGPVGKTGARGAQGEPGVNPENAHLQPGNTYGETFIVGSLDTFDVEVITNAISRVHIDKDTGNVNIGDAMTSAESKLTVTTSEGNDGIFVEGTDRPSVGAKDAGDHSDLWRIAASSANNDLLSGCEVGDAVLLTPEKSFFISVKEGISSLISQFVNKVNGRVAIGGKVTRATLHVNGSLGLTAFSVPTQISVDTTIDLLTREHQTFLAYSVDVAKTLTLTPLDVSTDNNTGNASRVFWITNTGLGTIDFGGSALVKGLNGSNFTTSGANRGMMFIIMGTYMQQVM